MVPKHPQPVLPPNFFAPQPANRALIIFLIAILLNKIKLNYTSIQHL